MSDVLCVLWYACAIHLGCTVCAYYLHEELEVKSSTLIITFPSSKKQLLVSLVKRRGTISATGSYTLDTEEEKGGVFSLFLR